MDEVAVIRRDAARHEHRAAARPPRSQARALLTRRGGAGQRNKPPPARAQPPAPAALAACLAPARSVPLPSAPREGGLVRARERAVTPASRASRSAVAAFASGGRLRRRAGRRAAPRSAALRWGLRARPGHTAGLLPRPGGSVRQRRAWLRARPHRMGPARAGGGVRRLRQCPSAAARGPAGPGSPESRRRAPPAGQGCASVSKARIIREPCYFLAILKLITVADEYKQRKNNPSTTIQVAITQLVDLRDNNEMMMVVITADRPVFSCTAFQFQNGTQAVRTPSLPCSYGPVFKSYIK